MDVAHPRRGSGGTLSDSVQRADPALLLHRRRTHRAVAQSRGMCGARRRETPEFSYHGVPAHRSYLFLRRLRRLPRLLTAPRRHLRGREMHPHIPRHAAHAHHFFAVRSPAQLVLGQKKFPRFLLSGTGGRGAENRLLHAACRRFLRRIDGRGGSGCRTRAVGRGFRGDTLCRILPLWGQARAAYGRKRTHLRPSSPLRGARAHLSLRLSPRWSYRDS